MTATEVDIHAIEQSARRIAEILEDLTDSALGVDGDLHNVLLRQAEAQERIAAALEKMVETEIDTPQAEVSE